MRVEVDHQEIQELLGAYSLHAVDSEEAVIVEEHLGRCNECRTELEQHLEVASLLSATERFAPGELWDTITRQLANDQEWDQNPSIELPHTATAPMRRRWLVPMAAAAALVLMVGATVVQSVRLDAVSGDLTAEQEKVAALNQQLDRPPLNIAVAQALAGTGNQQVTLGSQVSGSNAIIVLMPDGTGYLAEHTLRPLPEDRTYQLWAIVDGRVISAGILGPDPNIVPFRIDPKGFEGFAITEEVIGGVESSQNDPVVAWLSS